MPFTTFLPHRDRNFSTEKPRKKVKWEKNCGKAHHDYNCSFSFSCIFPFIFVPLHHKWSTNKTKRERKLLNYLSKCPKHRHTCEIKSLSAHESEFSGIKMENNVEFIKTSCRFNVAFCLKSKNSIRFYSEFFIFPLLSMELHMCSSLDDKIIAWGTIKMVTVKLFIQHEHHRTHTAVKWQSRTTDVHADLRESQSDMINHFNRARNIFNSTSFQWSFIQKKWPKWIKPKD